MNVRSGLETESTTLRFDRFRFDAGQQRLEDASGPIHLNPKACAVLAALIARGGDLVRKDELLDTIWPDTHVADGVLKVCVAEIRKALGDSPTAPRFIETVHGRGYRFVAHATPAKAVSAPPLVIGDRAGPVRSVLAWPAGASQTAHGAVGLVGRGRELQLLDERFAASLRGERQVVFVTGEPGAGKTALVEHFAAAAAERTTVAITGSECLERFGTTEAYMPVLEAVGRLVREEHAIRPLLRRFAPTWFAQLPWLIEEDDRDRLGRELFGAARERMLREMAEFVEALGAQIPLVLVLEDMHWSDPSTVDLLSLLAARREPARLLVLATYRPVELILAGHPLRPVAQQLAAGHRCAELALGELAVGAVGQYVERRFAGSRFRAELAQLLHARTDGNPLFLVTLVDHLVARGAIVEEDRGRDGANQLRQELSTVPESVRLLIGQQLARLRAEDREVLEAASLAGIEFSAATVAAALARPDRGSGKVEECCEQIMLAGPFLRRTADVAWPDGTVSAGYAFRHSLHRETLAAVVPARRRAELHHRIGTVLEAAYGDRSLELAAELALHFEEGGDRARAARYHRSAAETAASRYAVAEAETHLEKGLALLRGLPPSAERDGEELRLQSMLGAARITTRGYADPEVEGAYQRALELASAAPPDPSIFAVLWGLFAFYSVRGDLGRALELAERMRVIADASGDRLMRLAAHHGLWTAHFFRGDLAAALHHLDEGEPLYDIVTDRRAGLAYGQDQKTAALAHRAILEWYLGYVDQALETSSRAVDHARALGHPNSLAFAMSFDFWLRILRREPQACLERAEAVIAYATENGMPHWIPGALHARGWALAQQGELERGMADVQHGLAVMTAIGGNLGRAPRTHDFAVLKARAGCLAEARELLEESRALADVTGEHYNDSEIFRTDAELILAEGGGASAAVRQRAQASLHAAIDCARRQGARMLELRGVTALVRLSGGGAKGRQAGARLADLLASFREGFDTADLQEARRLGAR